MVHRQKVKNFVDVKGEVDKNGRITIKADNFVMPLPISDQPAPYLSSGGRLFVDVKQVNTLIAAARSLCDNVQTVGTHHRVDGKYLDALRQAIDRL